ncbi:STAS domain-containing protein [Mycolicibacterium vaccae]|jgi:anti-anti-sigma factor|uniref:Anti-sigma factor antagonist n=1 Tax=Mycolicibacterium vaccae ATCC 25954 TaxID=1194972 RepID=K0UL45_MYCVA|nr:STAS domain-containing protein [Mycolicibacterium vaccae]ANI42755.1 anti-sigma factor antagonist [Mycolicibacterium vaccae 95051]EJZ07491.1 anti-sigma-factor antagonist [Mycolicibacterium vaccae ATCC 25954]MCV7062876.1 STAS domain-containing protein [Mycolicibacterium vaccae]
MKLTLAVQRTAPSAHIRVAGDLDYGSSGLLLDTVRDLLRAPSALQDLHLDFTDLAFCDSAGLSSLVLIHRQTAAAGVQLHLDQRPAQLQRILDVTGLLEFLTTRPAAQQPDESGIG